MMNDMTTLRSKLLLFIGMLFIVLHSEAQSAPAEPQPEKLLRLPGATLLVGDPPRRLFLVAEDKVVTLQNDTDAPSSVGPSVSADGGVVASGVPADPPQRSPRNIVKTYSVREKKWTDHHFVIYGRVSISPDGTQLAFQAEEATGDQPAKVRIVEAKTGSDWMGARPARVHILNIKTGKVTILSTPIRTGSTLSWSRDGLRLAIDGVWEPSADERTFQTVEPSIYAVAIASGAVTKIAAGNSPSWSPNGEWIALIVAAPRAQTLWQAPRYRIKLIRPDGTDSRDIMDFGSWVGPNLSAVWSPDSKSLLVNVSRNPDENTWDIYQVDLATRKRTRKVRGTRDLVFGWVAAK